MRRRQVEALYYALFACALFTGGCVLIAPEGGWFQTLAGCWFLAGGIYFAIGVITGEDERWLD